MIQHPLDSFYPSPTWLWSSKRGPASIQEELRADPLSPNLPRIKGVPFWYDTVDPLLPSIRPALLTWRPATLYRQTDPTSGYLRVGGLYLKASVESVLVRVHTKIVKLTGFRLHTDTDNLPE